MSAARILRELRLIEAKLNYDIASLAEGTDIPGEWWDPYYASVEKLFEELAAEQLTTAEEVISTLELLRRRLDEQHLGPNEVKDDEMMIDLVIAAVERTFPNRGLTKPQPRAAA